VARQLLKPPRCGNEVIRAGTGRPTAHSRVRPSRPRVAAAAAAAETGVDELMKRKILTIKMKADSAAQQWRIRLKAVDHELTARYTFLYFHAMRLL